MSRVTDACKQASCITVHKYVHLTLPFLIEKLNKNLHAQQASRDLNIAKKLDENSKHVCTYAPIEQDA